MAENVRRHMPPWAAVPRWLVFSEEITGNDVLVWITIYFHAWQEEGVSLTQSAIAEESGLSLMTTRKSIAALVKAGALTVEERTGSHGRLPNLYTVNDDHLQGIDRAGYTKNVQPRGERTCAPLLSSEEKKTKRGPTKNRAPDMLWDACARAHGVSDPKLATPTELSFISKMTSELKKAGATPETFEVAVANYKREWSDLTFSLSGLVKHWARFSPKTPASRPPKTGPRIPSVLSQPIVHEAWTEWERDGVWLDMDGDPCHTSPEVFGVISPEGNESPAERRCRTRHSGSSALRS